MPLTIDQLFSAPSADTFRANMVTALVALQVPADKWRKGGVASTMLTVVSMSLAAMAVVVSTLIKGFFLPTATGDNLKLLAQYIYGVTVPSATYATGNLTLTNGGGGIYTVGVGQYSALNPTTGVTYTNTASFVLNALSTISVPMQATVAGSAGNADVGTITSQVTILLGVTVTNPTSFVGVDAPDDATIRNLCTNALGAMSVRGVRSAYAYAIQTAKNSVTNSPVNINRFKIVSDSHFGTVQIYVAAPTGITDPNDITGISNNIEAVARPEAVLVTVSGAAPINYSANVTVYCAGFVGLDPAVVATAIGARFTKLFSTYPIGGVTASDDAFPTGFTGMFRSAVYGAAAQGCADVNAQFLSGVGGIDLPLTDTQVAANAINLAVRIVAPNAGTVAP